MRLSRPNPCWVLLAAATLGMPTGGPMAGQTLDNVEWVLEVEGFSRRDCWVFPRVPGHREARALFACLDQPEARFVLALRSEKEPIDVLLSSPVPTASFDLRANVTYIDQGMEGVDERTAESLYQQFRAGHPALPGGTTAALLFAAEVAPSGTRRMWVEPERIASLGAGDSDRCAVLVLTERAAPGRALRIECADPDLDLGATIAPLRQLWGHLGGAPKIESWSIEGRFVHADRFYSATEESGVLIVDQAAYRARLARAQVAVAIENVSTTSPDVAYRRLRQALVHRDPARIDALRDDYFVQSAEIYLLAPTAGVGGMP